MTRSPGWRRGSSPPHTPAETTSGSASPSRRGAQRDPHRTARSPTGARRRAPRPKAGKENARRGGNSRWRASARASSSTAVRIRIGFTARCAGGRGLVPLLALHPGLPAVAGRRVLARELDVRDLGVRDGERSVALLVEKLDEGVGHQVVPVEDIPDDFGPVRLDEGGVAPVVEREVDHLGEREVLADLRHPPFQCHHRRRDVNPVGPIAFAILRSRSAGGLNVQPRTPRPPASLGPRLARHLPRLPSLTAARSPAATGQPVGPIAFAILLTIYPSR